MSLRTDDIDTKIQIKGQIFLILSYNKKTSNLNIHVKRCQDLAIANIKKKTSDPYVKFYLLPDKNKSDKRKTSIQRNNCNPVYDEELRVIINYIYYYEHFIQVTFIRSSNFEFNFLVYFVN